jgi:DNA-binding CsgD family transcriptional regulator
MLEGRDSDSHRGDPLDFPIQLPGRELVSNRISVQRDCQTPPGRCSASDGRNTLISPLQDVLTRPAVRTRSSTARAAVTSGAGFPWISGALGAHREAAANGPLLERQLELERIEAALADARSGHGRFLVIEGPAGIGKTALLAAVRTMAGESGMRVLRSRGNELERDFAFGVVRQLFEPPLAEAPELERADLLQAGAGVAGGLLAFPGAPAPEGLPPSGVDPSFAILHSLYWLCANLAAAGPLCIVVDDAHWADAPSLRYLAFLLTRLEELNIALVLATRPREAGTDAELLATVTADPSAEVIRLPLFTSAAVAELVQSRLGRVPDPAFVEACLAATRGMPFLMRELVEALNEGGIAPTAEAAHHVEGIGAHTVGRSIRLRLRQLPKHAGLLARALAILEQSDLLQASRLASLDDAEAADAADLLATAGILESGRPLTFIHPIVRSGLYSELTTAERSRGHRRAAGLLAERMGANERVANHLLISEPAGDGWVVERLVEAARAATHNGAPESAAVFLRRAIDEPPPPGDQSGLLLELGMAEASAGLATWQEHLQLAVDAAPNPAAAAGAARVLARALSQAQRYGEAVEVLDGASSALDSSHAELALQLEAAAVVAGMSDPATAPSVAARRAALRERVDGDHAASPELLAVGSFISVLTNEPAEVGAELATRALLAGEGTAQDVKGGPWFSSATFARATLSLLWAERYDEVRPLLDASIAQARVTGDSGRLAVGLASRGWLALRRGDLYAAEIETRTALAATELPAPPTYRVLNGGLLVKALVDQGELDAAEQELASLQSEAEGGFVTTAVLRLARGRLRVEQGRVAEGLEDFLGVGVALTRAMVTSPSYLPWRSEAALAHLALGDHEAAGRLAQEELELARAFGAPRALGVASRAAGVVAGGEHGEFLLREAVDAFEHGDAGLERARALTDLGAMLRRRNRRTEARELLREALDAAHRAGARTLADYAETELRATGARPRRVVLTGLDSLTASERRIAEHASQGLTNREIAQTLFVTARTVEGHLTSIFRKLRLDSRNDLCAALAGETPVTPAR